MTDQALTARLRRHRYNTWNDDLGPEPDKALAADRIEELVKETELLTKEVKLLEIGFDAAQAKLTKAVEALQYADRMVRLVHIYMTDWDNKDFSQAVFDTGKRIATTLAELEGKG